MISAMGTVWVAVPRLAARASESLTEPGLEYGEGMSTQVTLAGPRASAAMAAVSAESMPPERPITAREKPHLCT